MVQGDGQEQPVQRITSELELGQRDVALQSLDKYNAIVCSNVFALDNALRLMGSSIALFNIYAPQDAKLSPRLATLLAGKISDTRFVNRLTYGVPCSVADHERKLGAGKAVPGRLAGEDHGIQHAGLLPFGARMVPVHAQAAERVPRRGQVVTVELQVLARVLHLRPDRPGQALQHIKRGLDSSKSTPEEKQTFAKQKQDQQLAFSSAVADFVIALQYSSTTPVFANNTVTWAIWYGGAAGLYKRWLARS
ncbi:hypothetical protein BASA81_000156 [Batrachochytrium salamandrivorans]|nr:hypothetical protein BASA81_000156 [Batrachochytrium salamandrivorans]